MPVFARSVTALTLVALVTASAGCYHTEIVAPPGSTATLAPKLSACTQISHRRVHYVLWGLIPLNDETTQGMIPAGGQVQVIEEVGPVDFLFRLVGLATGWIYAGSTSLRVKLCR